jgi:hypothetical protein
MNTAPILVSLLPAIAALAATEAELSEPAGKSAGESMTEAERSFNVDLDLVYASQYIFRGIEYAEHSLQPAATVTSGNLHAGLWMNQPLSGDYDNEIDFLAGFDLPLYRGWALTLGGAVYAYPELSDEADGDRATFEPKVALSGPVGPLTPALTFYYDLVLKVATYEALLEYRLDLTEALSLDLGAVGAFVCPDEGEDYAYWGATAGLSYALSDHWSLYASGNYASHDLSGEDRDHLFALAGVTFSL